MKKVVDRFVIFKKENSVVIGDMKHPEGDQLLISKEEDGQISVTVASKMLQQNSFSLDLEALQAAIGMLAEPAKMDISSPGQATCRDCKENPNTVGCIPVCPAQTFCQAARTPLIDLKSQCPLLMAPADLRELCQHHRQGDELDDGKSLCQAYAGDEKRECGIKNSRDLIKCLDFQIHIVET